MLKLLGEARESSKDMITVWENKFIFQYGTLMLQYVLSAPTLCGPNWKHWWWGVLSKTNKEDISFCFDNVHLLKLRDHNLFKILTDSIEKQTLETILNDLRAKEKEVEQKISDVIVNIKW
jgi:hypothetical protein